MPKALVTGAGGLVGSEAVRACIEQGFKVVGVDNNMRAQFFGPEAETGSKMLELKHEYPDFLGVHADIRDREAMEFLFKRPLSVLEPPYDLIIHTAAQPSHDWAAKDPHTDFGVNAVGTLNLLQNVRNFCPEATFAHISTSKVYGDTPNRLPLFDRGTRLDLDMPHPYYEGIDIDMSVDNCLHSLFGVSKLSGDLLVQEFGRYFGIPTVCFRPGCVTGPAHAGVELHGFLAYLMKCAVTGRPYTIYGYGGKQVRCNIYARDLALACLEFHVNPKVGAVYNIGGGRQSACSMDEAITLCEEITGNDMDVTYSDEARIGDHKWWISDIARFRRDYPGWLPLSTVDDLLEDIFEANRDAWLDELAHGEKDLSE